MKVEKTQENKIHTDKKKIKSRFLHRKSNNKSGKYE